MRGLKPIYRLNLDILLNLIIGALFVIFAVAAVLKTHHEVHQYALVEAKTKSRIILDYNLALHTYLTRQSADTPTTQEINTYFDELHSVDYSYKEIAGNAEADDFEQTFMADLRRDPSLQTRSSIQTINGKPYYVTLQQMPSDLIRATGDSGQATAAISIRVPLSQAYTSADDLANNLTHMLLLLLGVLFIAQWLSHNYFVLAPLRIIQDRARFIAQHNDYSGEPLRLPIGRELGDLAAAFNAMLSTMSQGKDGMEDIIQERTQKLEQVNEQLRQDILRREGVESALRSSEEKFRSIVEQSRDGIILVDAAGIVVEWNLAQEQITGQKRADVVGKTSWDVFYALRPVEQQSPELYERLKTNIASFLATQTTPTDLWEYEIQGKDDPGKRRFVQFMVFLTEYQESKLFVCMVHDITEHKRIEKAWRNSEQRYRVLFDNAGDAIYLHDLDGKILDANDIACKQIGYSRTELLNMNMRDINTADHESDMVTYFWMLRSSNSVLLEFSQRRQDGTLLPVEVNARLIEQQDQPVVLSISRDITLRKRVEEAERRQRILAEALCDTAAALTDTLDLDGVLDRILQNVGRVVPHDEVIVMLYDDEAARVMRHHCYHRYNVTDKTNLVLPRSRLSQLIGQAFTVDDIQVDTQSAGILVGFEQMRSVIGVPIRQENRVIGALKLGSSTPGFYNITHILHLQAFAEQAALALQNAELYAAERRERILAQTFQQITETLSSSAHLEEALGTAIERLYNAVSYDHAAVLLVEGEQLHSVVTRGILAISAPQPTYTYADIPLFYQPLSSGQPLVLTDAQQHPDHTYLIADACTWIGVPLVVWDIVLGIFTVTSKQAAVYSPSDVDTVTAFAHQIAQAIENSQLYSRLEMSQLDLREAHAHLNQTARLSLAGKIAASVAHQINNPLTAVMAQSYLLMKKFASDPRSYKSAEIIYQSAGQAASVVQRLLDFARPSDYNQSVIDINASLLYAISLVRAQIEPNVAHLNVQLTPGLPHIRGSDRHLEDLWINLILNAKDAVNDCAEGIITVSSRLLIDRQSLEVTISDNGVGISQDALPHIFEPFFTTKQNGNGLGLPICYDVVTRHHGTMQVTSAEGEGTTFTIILPVENDSLAGEM